MINLVVIGVGLIGRRHVKAVNDHPNCNLAGIVDADPDVVAQFGDLGFAAIADVTGEVDGAIIASPTGLHAEHAIQALERGWPILIEKPIAGTLTDAQLITQQAKATGLPTLVGHHRRYHKTVQHLKSMVANKDIGDLVIASAIWAVRKPDSYFKDNWRSAEGSPVMINLVHDIDVMRFVFGEVVELTGLGSAPIRKETRVESGGLVMRFASGGIGTITFADTAPSPWGFEAGTAENPNIAATKQDMLFVMGSKSSISFPSMTHWTGSADWSQAPVANSLSVPCVVPLSDQLDHFLDVIAGEADPLIDVADAQRSLDVTLQAEAVLAQGSGA